MGSQKSAVHSASRNPLWDSPPPPLPLHLPLFLSTSSSHSSAMLFNSGPAGCSPHIPPGCSADWTGRVESSYLPGGGEFCAIIGRRELNGSVGTPPTSLSTQKRRWQQLRSEERKKIHKQWTSETHAGSGNSWESHR